MEKKVRKDKYACFQWIRDVRAEMARDMAGMTPDERVEYMHTRAEAANRRLPRYTPEEAKKKLAAFLAEPPMPPKTLKPRALKRSKSRPAPDKRKAAPVRRASPAHA